MESAELGSEEGDDKGEEELEQFLTVVSMPRHYRDKEILIRF